MKNPLFLLCLFLLIGCKSIEQNKKNNFSKENAFIPLDSISVAKEMNGFSISIPKNWTSYISYHMQLWHSPKNLNIVKPKINTRTSKVMSVNNRVDFKVKMPYIEKFNYFTVYSYKNNKDINTFSYDKIKRLKRIYRGSKISKKGYKNKYGNYLIFKYGFVDLKAITHSVSEVVYFIEDKVYEFKYSSPNKDYDTYLPDVLKMIKSFKIDKKNSNEN